MHYLILPQWEEQVIIRISWQIGPGSISLVQQKYDQLCLNHNCNVVFPLHFKTTCLQILPSETSFGRGSLCRRLVLKATAVSYMFIVLISKKQFLHCFQSYNFVSSSLLNIFENANLWDLYYSFCDPHPSQLSLAFHPSNHFLPVVSYIIYTGLATVEFPPKTTHVYHPFPFTRQLNCIFFHLFSFLPGK